MFHESHARSVAKAISWRLLGTMATAALVYFFTRRLTLSLAVGGLEFVSKIGLFWLHERAWDRTAFGRREVSPAVIWFTGLSGSGKSTVADAVAEALRARGLRVERLDGDSIRDIFPSTGFTRPERDAHVQRVGFLAGKLERHGVMVVASFVSPYEASRQAVRAMCQTFVEVHISTPLAECERRDVKGLYARARRGELPHFTGIDDPYEAPSRPELVIDTTAIPVPEASNRVLRELAERGLGGL
jgi:adenylylsulfate kinase